MIAGGSDGACGSAGGLEDLRHRVGVDASAGDTLEDLDECFIIICCIENAVPHHAEVEPPADGGLVFSERPKTDRGRRTVDLDPGTVSVLRARKRQQTEHRLAVGAGWQDRHGLVFTEPDGRPLDPESVAQVFNRRVARSGLQRIRFHDLRHTHCAHLIEAGEQLLLITRRLGHASVAFTQDKYGHLFEEAGSQAASAVANMVDTAR